MFRSMLFATSLTALLSLPACAPSAPVDAESPPAPSAPPTPITGSTLKAPLDEPHAPRPEAASALPEPIAQAVAATDRSAEDRVLDEQRKPGKMLAFFGIQPGMRVAELATGGGYTAELLARVVGTNGKVFGQNSPFILQRFAEEPWSTRLKRPVMANAVRVDREFDDPLPKEATNLDAVLLVLFYHDTVWFETDRAAMNRAVYQALKPGGVYGIVDHSAREGDGVDVAKSLHRIEESVVREEVQAAAFRLEASADFLRNPDDPRDWNAAPSASGDKRGTSDRFVLKFVKPKE